MKDDDDVLAAYDLSAWDAPPPPAGIADAVIARARQAAPVGAIDRDEPMPRSRRRWWIAGAMAAVAVVAVVVGAWGIQRSPASGHGEVTATTARVLEVGPTTAALDPGAQVKWRRDRRTITAAQPRGAAMWNVAEDDTLVIDAGAMVASVEASGASLRVEVEMLEKTDARAVGISAATAVAVALVTIVVYEGTVRVRHDGQTVNVVPGAHYQVRPPSAPEPITVGGGPEDPRIKELEQRIKELEAERDARPPECDEVACVLNNYEGECCAKFKEARAPKPPSIPETLNRALISETMDEIGDAIRACPASGFTGTVKLTVKVAPDGSVTSAKVTTAKVPAALVSCIDKHMGSATFARTKLGGSFGYPFTFEACDAEALKQKGDDHLQTGMDAAALAAFEASMRCKPDPDLYRRAFLAACRSKNGSKANVYYPKLPARDRSSLSMMCVRNGIQLTEPAGDGECEPDEHEQRGDDHIANGNDAAALVSFEKALACGAKPDVSRKAFMAACRAKRKPSAQKHYAQLPAQQRSALAQICIRNGIAVDEEAQGVIKIASKPAARILLDGVDTGETTPATLTAAPGKHKVTFVVGIDKYTFGVTVKEGETTSLTKELE